MLAVAMEQWLADLQLGEGGKADDGDEQPLVPKKRPAAAMGGKPYMYLCQNKSCAYAFFVLDI